MFAASVFIGVFCVFQIKQSGPSPSSIKNKHSNESTPDTNPMSPVACVQSPAEMRCVLCQNQNNGGRDRRQ